jgi:hypothetical protein
MVGVGDVAGREHARRARLERLRDEDAVSDRDPSLLGELGSWLDADPDDDEVGGRAVPSARRTPSTRSAPSIVSTAALPMKRTP